MTFQPAVLRRAVPVLTIGLCFLSLPAFAANDALVKLLGLLRDRGSITGEEYADLVQLADPGATPVEAATPAPPSPTAAPAVAIPVQATPAAPAGTLAARVQMLEQVNQSGGGAKKAATDLMMTVGTQLRCRWSTA